MSERFDTHQQPTPTCPHCGHAMDHDDMLSTVNPGVDLFALAPREDTECITCPSCDQDYWVHGGYRPHYTTAFSQEELS